MMCTAAATDSRWSVHHSFVRAGRLLLPRMLAGGVIENGRSTIPAISVFSSVTGIVIALARAEVSSARDPSSASL
jgi:hypothetical protein